MFPVANTDALLPGELSVRRGVVSWDQCLRPEDWAYAVLGMEFLGGGALVLGSQGSRAAGMREPRWEIGTGDL